MGLLATLGLKQPKETAGSGEHRVAAAGSGDDDAPSQRTGKDLPPVVPPPPGGGTGNTSAPQTTGGAKTGATAPIAKTGAPAKSQEVIDYANARKAVKALADALNAHPQSSRIGALLGQIATKLASAGGHALKPDWPKAMADLEAAKTLCETAKKQADDWKTYAARRATVSDLGTSLKGLDDTTAGNVAGWLATADGMMQATPPDFAGAMDYLRQIDDAIKPSFRSRVDRIKTLLGKIEAMDAALQTFLAKELAEGRKIVADLEAAFAASNWATLIMLWRAGFGVLAGCERYGQRRGSYNTQRAKTAAAVAAVKALPAVADQGAGLDAALTEADTLASHKVMKFEEGMAKLVALWVRAEALKQIAPTAASHGVETQAATAELAALDAHAAAAQLTTQREAIRALLKQSAGQAAQARANLGSPTTLWAIALTTVQRARLDLATAKTLAAGLGPAAAAQAAAKGGGGTNAIKKALDALQADLAVAAKAPHADQAKAQFEQCRSEAAAATKALEKDTKAAAQHLGAAGQALAAARGIQAAHAQFVTTLADAEARLAQLKALTHAAKIGPRIAAVADAIASARKLAAQQQGASAIAALRIATDGVAAAQQADRERGAHEVLAKSVSDRLGEVGDAKLKKTLAKAVEDAGKQADGLAFADAAKALRKVLVQIDEVKLQAGMKATPPDPKLREIAKAMLANGGAAQVDAAIQASPAGQPKVITELASARYGKEFTIQGSAPGANEVQSLKRCCEVFAKIADDIVDNPSIKNVTHVDIVPAADGSTSAGGGYTASTGRIGMEGRVGIQQKFGKNETNYDPKTRTQVKALPADIDPACLPATNDDVEYLGFAAAHEVGHGVDDLRGFMAKNGGQEKYGGWIEFGGNVQPIADAAGASIAGKHKTSSFWKTPESKQYVLDKLLNRNPDKPNSCQLGHADFKQADLDAYNAFDSWHALATASDVYRRQGDCDKIQIGKYIYHEAYPRSWVGYLAAARSKGLTGYQFRAPAEWFAELYAGWKSGRLGDKHPALEWLKKL